MGSVCFRVVSSRSVVGVGLGVFGWFEIELEFGWFEGWQGLA